MKEINMNEIYCIRRFIESDAEEVSKIIIKTLRTTNIKDYSAEYIENDVKEFTPEGVIKRASWTHFYVVCENETIVGCGAIGSYWGKRTKAVCLQYLYYQNIKVKELVGELLRH